MPLSPPQIAGLNPGDLLVDPRADGPEHWFVCRNIGGRPGLRIVSQSGMSLTGRDATHFLSRLEMVRRNPAPRRSPAAQPRPHVKPASTGPRHGEAT